MIIVEDWRFDEASNCFDNQEFRFAEERGNEVRGVNVNFLVLRSEGYSKVYI